MTPPAPQLYDVHMRLVGRSVGRPVGRSVDRSVSRSVGRSVGQTGGRSVGRPVDRRPQHADKIQMRQNQHYPVSVQRQVKSSIYT